MTLALLGGLLVTAGVFLCLDAKISLGVAVAVLGLSAVILAVRLQGWGATLVLAGATMIFMLPVGLACIAMGAYLLRRGDRRTRVTSHDARPR
jgi:hypothetical protein